MKNLSSNMEDYLETIFLIQQENGNVRIKEIAGRMECTMPSVSSAVKNLRKKGLVYHSRYNTVELTLSGARIAEKVFYRHSVLKIFLSQVLGLEADVAEKDACLMEHAISEKTLEKLLDFMKTCEGVYCV